jgi:hypothetical protein
MTQELFQLALNITDPWFVSDLNFDVDIIHSHTGVWERGVKEDCWSMGARKKEYNTKAIKLF